MEKVTYLRFECLIGREEVEPLVFALPLCDIVNISIELTVPKQYEYYQQWTRIYPMSQWSIEDKKHSKTFRIKTDLIAN